jgi:hypothetical protein
MTYLRAALLSLGLGTAGLGCLTTGPTTTRAPSTAQTRATAGAPLPFPETGTKIVPAQPRSAAFTDGYRAGVLHHLDGGPQPQAPLQYRLANHWDVRNPGAEEWSEGFRNGFAGARRSGLPGPSAVPAVATAQKTAPGASAGGFRSVAQVAFLPVSTPPIDPGPGHPVPAPASTIPTLTRASKAVLETAAAPTVSRIERAAYVATAPAIVPRASEFAPWHAAPLPPPSVVHEGGEPTTRAQPMRVPVVVRDP